MIVRDLMSKPAATCGPDDSLHRAAQIMWEQDCGAVPVINEHKQVVGMITDRDICMAAYLQGKGLPSIKVSTVMSMIVHSCTPLDSIADVERMMREHQVRRLPVVDVHDEILGMISLNDIVRGTKAKGRDGLAYSEVAITLAAICAPRQASSPQR